MQRRLERIVNHPFTDLAVVLLILLSVALLVVEATIPEQHPFFVPAELAGHALTGVFILELLLRLLAMRKRRRFFRVYWLDILAVMPVMRSLRILRVLRLLRLFRLGTLVNRRLLGLSEAFRHGKTELLTVAVIVLVVVLASAIGMNLLERGSEEEIFHSIEGSTWWSLYTLVSGEPQLGTPTTFAGRLLALVVMLGGLGFFATFTGIISAAMVTRLSKRMEVREMVLDEVNGHVVICGWNRVAPRVIEELLEDPKLRKKHFVLIAEMDAAPAVDGLGLRPEQFFFISGDFTRIEVLSQAGIERAQIAILLADRTLTRSDQDRDARTVLAALTIEKLNRDIFTCVELLNRDNRQHLAMAGVEEIVVPDEYAGRIIAASSRTRGLVNMFDELLTSRYGNQIFKAEVLPGWADQTVGWAYRTLKERYNAVLLAVECCVPSDRKVQVNPPSDAVLRKGDRLIFIAEAYPEDFGAELMDSLDVEPV
ncbi:MAG: ion transporter [Deltaproteobacteria bacterium]|nr:ion transporter [Deltaproteobacteria bacterium]